MSSKTSPDQPDLFADAPKPLTSKKDSVAIKERCGPAHGFKEILSANQLDGFVTNGGGL